MEYILTPETLTFLAGFLLSYVVELVPKLNSWYAGLSGAQKRGIMLLFTILTAAGVYGLSCAGLGWISPGFFVSCDVAGLQSLGQILIMSIITLVANQGVGFPLNNLATAESRALRFGE